MKTTKTKNKVLEWFVKEGTVKQEENLYIANKAFLANTVVNSIRRYALEKKITPEEVEKSMNMVRLFIQDKLDLKWSGDIIQVLLHSKNVSSPDLGATPDERQGNGF